MNGWQEILFVSLWFVSGIAGFHIICAVRVAGSVDTKDDYEGVWVSLIGPFILVAALLICVEEACTKSKEDSE